ncbi:MAG: hypothetical protein ACX94C_01620 [Phycisphaerales bacterium]
MKAKAILGAICAAALSTLATAEPFTYQGSLDDNGAPANGEYDLRFELYDAQVGGNMIGGIQGEENYQVIDGIFTVELDFGPGAFDASSRYLRVGVRPGDSGGLFTFLDPRTPINPAPKAQHATTADGLTNPIWNRSGSVFTAGSGLSRVLINRDDPITSSEYFGVHAQATGFVGMYISGPTDSFPFYGYSVNDAISAYTYFDSNNDSWNVVGAGGVTSLRVTSGNDVEVSNDITAESFQFETPKLNYYSISGNSFHCASNDPFFASSGSGGAYIATPGVGYLVAPVNLPHGATITRMRAYCDDNSATGDLSISLSYQTHGGSAFFTAGGVNTAGFSGSNIALFDDFSHLVNNNTRHYHIRVFSSNWSGSNSMRIDSVVIEYTTTEAD